MTETDQFRRLVRFLEDTEDYALNIGDVPLRDRVQECYRSLAEMASTRAAS